MTAANVPFSQPHSAPLKPADLQDDDGKVTMVFPRRVLLTLNDRRTVDFPPGVQEVPASLADHPYLQAHGVKRHERQDLKPPTLEVLGEAHVEFLQKKGFAITSVEQANRYFSNLLPEQRDSFLAEFLKAREAKGAESIFNSPAGTADATANDDADGTDDEGEQTSSGQDQQTTRRKKRA